MSKQNKGKEIPPNRQLYADMQEARGTYWEEVDTLAHEMLHTPNPNTLGITVTINNSNRMVLPSVELSINFTS